MHRPIDRDRHGVVYLDCGNVWAVSVFGFSGAGGASLSASFTGGRKMQKDQRIPWYEFTDEIASLVEARNFASAVIVAKKALDQGEARPELANSPYLGWLRGRVEQLQAQVV